MIKEEQLTPEVRNELNYIKHTNQTAFDMLVSNFNGNFIAEISFKDIVTRLQTQYVVNCTEESLKTISEWNQNEYNEPHEINRAIPAVTSGKYSSFALKDLGEDYEINYPLDIDYATSGIPFASTDVSSTQVNIAYKQLSQKLGLNVTESPVATSSIYKTPNKIMSSAILKIKNLFLKLAKKPQLQSNIFKGKLTLQTKVGGYAVSNVEKIIKAYDLVLKKSIERDAKQIKKHTKQKVSPEIKYASRLFADVLMTRINDLGNIQNNKVAEQAIWLQFAGVLNRYGFNAQELSQITELGSMAVANTCVDLGITKEKVVERMTRLGFKYTSVPNDIAQALLNVKEIVQDKFNFAEQEEIKTGIAALNPEMPINTEEINIDVDEFKEKIEEQLKSTELTKISKDLEAQEVSNIKASTVEKNVDKLVVKFLANVTTTLADKIDSGKVKGKKLDKANAQLRMYNLTLAYYVQATNKKSMAVKGDYTESEISKAKQIVTGILFQKKQVAQMISTSQIERVEGQTTSSYMNAVCKQNLNNTLRDYFLKLIKGCVDYCVDQQFGKNSAKTENEEIKEEILSLVGNLESKENLENISETVTPETVLETETQKDDENMDDFIKKPDVEQLEMDLGFPSYEQLELDLDSEKLAPKQPTKEETGYVPNFVFVNEPNNNNEIER